MNSVKTLTENSEAVLHLRRLFETKNNGPQENRIFLQTMKAISGALSNCLSGMFKKKRSEFLEHGPENKF